MITKINIKDNFDLTSGNVELKQNLNHNLLTIKCYLNRKTTYKDVSECVKGSSRWFKLVQFNEQNISSPPLKQRVFLVSPSASPPPPPILPFSSPWKFQFSIILSWHLTNFPYPTSLSWHGYAAFSPALMQCPPQIEHPPSWPKIGKKCPCQLSCLAMLID